MTGVIVTTSTWESCFERLPSGAPRACPCASVRRKYGVSTQPVGRQNAALTLRASSTTEAPAPAPDPPVETATERTESESARLDRTNYHYP
eukprot:1196236-Prorocentrum_minimum.AAC.5